MKIKGAYELKNQTIRLMGKEFEIFLPSAKAVRLLKEKIKPKGAIKIDDDNKQTEEFSEKQNNEFLENIYIATFIKSCINIQDMEFETEYDIDNLNYEIINKLKNEIESTLGLAEYNSIMQLGLMLMVRDEDLFKKSENLFLLMGD